MKPSVLVVVIAVGLISGCRLPILSISPSASLTLKSAEAGRIVIVGNIQSVATTTSVRTPAPMATGVILDRIVVRDEETFAVIKDASGAAILDATPWASLGIDGEIEIGIAGNFVVNLDESQIVSATIWGPCANALLELELTYATLPASTLLVDVYGRVRTSISVLTVAEAAFASSILVPAN